MKKEILHLTGLLAAAVFCSTVGAQTNFTLRPLTTPDFGGHGDGSIHPGDQPYVTGQSTTPYPGRDYQRGLAWDPATGNLILVDRHTGGASSTPYMTGNIEVLDGASGGGVGVLKIDGVDTNGQAILTNGDYVTCAAAVGDDGAVYVGNLVNQSSSSPYKLYRWESSATYTDPVVAYQGNPGGAGYGQSWSMNMAARGAGTNTQILIGSRTTQGLPGTNVAIFTTTDGTNFTPVVLATDAPEDSFARAGGMAFGAGNTFWTTTGTDTNSPPVLRYMSFDLAAKTATTIKAFDTTLLASSANLGPIAVDVTNNLLAALDYAVGPDHVRLYDISNLGIPPVLLDIKDFPSSSVDTLMGYMNFGGTNLYVHDMNNGILALPVNPATNTSPAIITQPSPATQKVGMGGSASFQVFAYRAASYQWRLNDVNVSGATNCSLVLTNAQESNQGDYTVVLANSAGAVTSSVVHLTVVFPDDFHHLSEIWHVTPGTRPYVTTDATSTPFQRSIAYNALSNHVIIISRTNATQQASLNGLSINVLDGSTGADLWKMETNGIVSAANNNSIILLGMGVADDGVVYAGNCYSASSGTATYRVYRWDNSGSSSVAKQVYGPADPAGQAVTVRWGDAMSVRGAGPNTQIVLDSNPGTLAALLTTIDGTNFTSAGFWRTNGVKPGGGQYSIGRSLQFDSTGTNRIWQKRYSDRLDLGGWDLNPSDPNYQNSLYDLDYTNYTFLPGTIGPVALDLTNKLLAGINFHSSGSPDTVDLYDITDFGSPLFLGQYPFPVNHQPNVNFIGQVVSAGSNRVYAVDGNNGVVAFAITPPLTPTLRMTPSGANVVLAWTNSVSGWTLQSTTNLASPVWASVTNAMMVVGNQKTVTDSAGAAARFYRLRKPGL